MDEARAFVEKKLKEHKVVVFSKTYCPYCKKAKGVLAKYNIAPEELDITELDKMDSGKAESVQDYMETLTGARSVPRVFIDGKFIGGGDDTERLDKSGKLKDILDTAGVR
ncbi:uncharacterized protein LOC129582953 isoform X2 [Paramacrobiotus metropolitanus]|nr:uncharacterized protein LOC129582953 isoform X2 [Paramacrobiotus metropolitanus]XP_055330578.1 uncharacterized protein LOC129582953 isoform X2 [Paramacrobiotus metropolitanus]